MTVNIKEIEGTAEQVAALAAADQEEGPLTFVNLLKFYDVARYDEVGLPDPAESGQSTGKEAYERYGAVAFVKVTERGGRIVILSDVNRLVVGDTAQDWDQVAIAEYPNRAAFRDMIEDPEYKAALDHRSAGLAKTVLLDTTRVI